ncbi:MAG: AAC(3) family N-acetyltransferase [Candidatus Latescibacteria bacterium]|nr:AAC(3) family N-acetyltransferase [Candidatus Latescibacterota bacterium]
MTEFEAQQRIAQDLLSSGLRKGGAVLVHASLRSMGHVPGGAETVIRGLLDALGPDGTLLMPALSYTYVNAAHPVFDVLRTPSNIGTIAETFRTRLGTMRSVCPTHSVCGVGTQAEHLLKDHHLDESPCGSHSPYRMLRDAGGQILFLGCGLKPNTSMHGVEELVEPPYLFGPILSYRIILPDGTETHLNCRRHDFAGYAQHYDRIGPLLKEEEDGLKMGTVLAAAIHILECRAMWSQAWAALQRDPFFFVEARQ